MRLLRFTLVVGLLAGPLAAAEKTEGAAARPSYMVIVNAENKSEPLKNKEVSNLLLRKQTRWKHNRKTVKPVDQTYASAARKLFTSDVHGASTSQIQRYWRKRIFSGRDVPPKQFKNDQAVIDYVKANADAVGYVSGTATLPKGVRRLSVPDADPKKIAPRPKSGAAKGAGS
jgi:ABC-type phosphate transport system substrate-binding protein